MLLLPLLPPQPPPRCGLGSGAAAAAAAFPRSWCESNVDGGGARAGGSREGTCVVFVTRPHRRKNCLFCKCDEITTAYLLRMHGGNTRRFHTHSESKTMSAQCSLRCFAREKDISPISTHKDTTGQSWCLRTIRRHCSRIIVYLGNRNVHARTLRARETITRAHTPSSTTHPTLSAAEGVEAVHAHSPKTGKRKRPNNAKQIKSRPPPPRGCWGHRRPSPPCAAACPRLRWQARPPLRRRKTPCQGRRRRRPSPPALRIFGHVARRRAVGCGHGSVVRPSRSGASSNLPAPPRRQSKPERWAWKQQCRRGWEGGDNEKQNLRDHHEQMVLRAARRVLRESNPTICDEK